MRHTVGWLVFLSLLKSFLCDTPRLFETDRTADIITAKVGSCVELIYRIKANTDIEGGTWNWIKDAKWIETDFVGTIVYSTIASTCSEDFKGRAAYFLSASATRNCVPSGSCEIPNSIRICELTKNDTGNYMLRYKKDQIKYTIQPTISVTVLDSSCPITFEQPPNVKENETVTLTCSTSPSCSSKLQIYESSPLPFRSIQRLPVASSSENYTFAFRATVDYNGAEFSCKTEDTNDIYLIRKVKLTVEYAPRDVVAEVTSSTVREGDTVTLTCRARGHPKPQFTWFKDGEMQSSGDTWWINSVKEAQSGSYKCIAKNEAGDSFSTVALRVNYKPDVEVQISQEHGGNVENVQEGARVSFSCIVKRSSPEERAIHWYKDGTYRIRSKSFVIPAVRPQDSGSYECTASNNVGTGKSMPRQFQVNYKPRNTRITPQRMNDYHVKVNTSLTMTCKTEAYPSPWFSWYRYRQTDRSKLTYMANQESLTLEKVRRADEACYTCNATNRIDSGDVSKPLCIHVLFPPTGIMLSMAAEVTEGQLVTITCSAESFPPPLFTLTRSNIEWKLSPTDGKNVARHNFTATWTDAADYTCKAHNSEGSVRSAPRRLVVKYAPKDVTVQVRPGLEVRENMQFRLDCRATSHPAVTSVTWKKSSRESEPVRRTGSALFVQSATLSDAGIYSCEATNEIGTRSSQQVEIKVLYGPKHTKIIKGEKHQLPDGTSVVQLRCLTHCYPAVKQYSWYKKANDDSGDLKVSDRQNISVSSQDPGEYYCIAENEISQRSSDPIPLFQSRVMTILKLFTIFCLTLFILSLVFFLYRHRRNKSIHQRPTNTCPCCGFLRKSSRSGNLMNEVALTGPSRSRDDLLLHQSRPDSMPASDMVYSTVNLPNGTPAPSAQRPVEQCGAQMKEDSLNYASLHFEKKHRDPKEESVYAKVSKPEMKDYENAAYADKPSPPSDYDTDTSEDEVEIMYSKVNFQPKAGHQKQKRDSSTSEENTQYSELQL